jgi:hypothetical protein
VTHPLSSRLRLPPVFLDSGVKIDYALFRRKCAERQRGCRSLLFLLTRLVSHPAPKVARRNFAFHTCLVPNEAAR